MTVLILADHGNAELRAATYNCIAAGEELAGLGAGDVHVLVAGADCAGAAAAAAAVPGVAKVLKADAPYYAYSVAENLAPLVVGLAPGYSHILAPATTFGKNVLPRIAALLDVQQISDISGIESVDTFVRPIHAGNVMATVQSSDAIKLITTRATAFEPVATEGGSASVEDIAAAEDAGLSSFVGQELTKSERPELTTARVVISGGRGMQSGENFHLLEKVADRLGAAVGASRAAVDAGYVPNDYQVGQTGKVVAPDLYIAVGISGAIQHLAGMKDSKVIVAINKDEEAPIFQVADYGLVADLFEAVPALESELEKQAS
jgi:electron transfer flavoprotein alpha subunit